MKKRYLIITITIVLLLLIFYLVYFRDDNIPNSQEKKMIEKNIIFTITDKNNKISDNVPVYWNNNKYAFFQDSNKICYLVKKIDTTEHKYGDENMNYISYDYKPVFQIYHNRYKKMKKAIVYNDNFYSFNEDKIVVYDMKKGKTVVYKINKYDILGFYEEKIYISRSKKYFILDLKFKKKINISSSDLPQKYDYLPFEIKIAK